MFTFLKDISLESWKDLIHELRKRLLDPLSDPVFVFYFAFIILGVGGVDIWISIVTATTDATSSNMAAVPRSLATYLLAIVAASFVDLSFLTFTESSVEPVGDRALPQKTRLSLWMLAISTLIVAVAFALISFSSARLRWTYGCAIFGTVAALFLWWIANYGNTKLRLPSAFAVTGGDTNAIEGSANNIQRL